MSYKVSHVRLLVNNFAECFRFYSEVLKMEHRAGDENGPYVEFLADGKLILALFRRDYMAQVAAVSDKPADASVQDIAALVIEVDDVDALAEELQNAGVTLVNTPMDMEQWVLRVAHFRDPAGNLIEINQPLSLS
jgi:catechol 2,3-dioxygenase-like lactoylglutathione lyase family enzyme